MTDKRLEQFYQLTGGNIARINSQMIDYFCSASLKPEEKTRYFVSIKLVICAAIALLAVSYVWQNHFLSSPTKNVAKQEMLQPIAEISQPLPSLVPLIPAIENEVDAVLFSRLPDINQELASQPSQVPGWLAAAVRQPVQPSPKRIMDIALDEEHNDSLVVRDRVVVIPKSLSTPLSVNASGSTREVSNKIKKAKLIKGQFTIQLLASRSQKEIRRFVKIHHIKKGAKIRLSKRDGLDWYVLTIGEYKQLEQAQLVIKNLPAELVRLKPWARPIGQLKLLG